MSDAFKINVVWRQDKGETSGIIQKALKKNENHVLDICLNGNFKESLIDKKILPKMIKGMIYGQTDNDWAKMTCLSSVVSIIPLHHEEQKCVGIL